jgi:hypothetical protein
MTRVGGDHGDHRQPLPTPKDEWAGTLCHEFATHREIAAHREAIVFEDVCDSRWFGDRAGAEACLEESLRPPSDNGDDPFQAPNPERPGRSPSYSPVPGIGGVQTWLPAETRGVETHHLSSFATPPIA